MSVLQKEQFKHLTHLKWINSSKTLVKTSFFVLLTVLSVLTVLSLVKTVRKIFEHGWKKCTSWLVETWKCEYFREFQFDIESFRTWSLNSFFEIEGASNNWVEKFSKFLVLFQQFQLHSRGYFREVFRKKSCVLEKELNCIFYLPIFRHEFKKNFLGQEKNFRWKITRGQSTYNYKGSTSSD